MAYKVKGKKVQDSRGQKADVQGALSQHKQSSMGLNLGLRGLSTTLGPYKLA